MSILMANVKAATENTQLSAFDKKLLQQYARQTRSGYCTGCTNICQPAVAADIPIGDIMRCLMYARSYGDRDRAMTHFKKIPQHIRHNMERMDYRAAEQKCPQKMAIGRLMREALVELG